MFVPANPFVGVASQPIRQGLSCRACPQAKALGQAVF
jgi:hypothetical protein